MDAEQRKQMKNAYKSQLSHGAVYAIDCAGNGRRLLKATTDLKGIRNRYNFSLSMNGCPDPALRQEWLDYGVGGFSLTVLEEMDMEEGQTAAEFAADIEALRELWQEKLAAGGEARTQTLKNKNAGATRSNWINFSTRKDA